MPEQFKQQKTFEFAHNSFITGEEQSVHADLDSLGRFIAKIPVQNSSEFFCDWSRCFVRTMLEPGKTYFMLYDFKEGRRYFMGEDARLQNELFKYPLDWESLRMEKGADFDPYIASADSLIKAQYAYIDELCKAHPTLSTRFQQYRKGNTLWRQARDFGQSRFRGKNYELSENAKKFAYDTFWTKLEKPYTLHRELHDFLRDYLADATNKQSYAIRITDQNMELYASNDEELALLTRWQNWALETTAAIEAASTTEEKQRIAQEQNDENAELVEAVNKILNGPRANKVINGQFLVQQLKVGRQVLDSLNADPLIKDIYLSSQAYDMIDNRRTSLLPQILDTLKTMISNPMCLERVEALNARYLAIENREFDKLVLKSSEDLADLSEGEALLKKILEPYKGKFVLLDIWGTWCSPCKEALSHSTEEYARLKDYDIEFLYLANNSPQASWENVIKEYNVSGDNVAHYNLPAEQQAAIERHLDVHSFPTYKLFDREGNLLDIEVDARQLEELVRLLEQLK
jgi:thiol-disulfide isomerase/thioredoxin